MPRKQKYSNSSQIISSFYKSVSDSYNSPAAGEGIGGKKKQTLLAEEFEISRIKDRKILITTGDITLPTTKEIQEKMADGKTLKEMQIILF